MGIAKDMKIAIPAKARKGDIIDSITRTITSLDFSKESLTQFTVRTLGDIAYDLKLFVKANARKADIIDVIVLSHGKNDRKEPENLVFPEISPLAASYTSLPQKGKLFFGKDEDFFTPSYSYEDPFSGSSSQTTPPRDSTPSRSDQKFCSATTKTGQPCKKVALKDQDLCATHDPKTKKKSCSARKTDGMEEIKESLKHLLLKSQQIPSVVVNITNK